MLRKAQKLIDAHAYAQARQELQKAVKDPATAPYAHSLLGQEYVRNLQFGDAVPELEQAVRALPSSVADRANLGYALMMTGEGRPAERELLRALELDPSNPRTHLVLGILYYAAPGHDPEAQEHLEFAAATLPSARLILAKFYRIVGRPEDSDREYQDYLRAPGAVNNPMLREWVEDPARSAAPQ